MEAVTSLTIQQKRLYDRAMALSLFTILYNLAEGLISVYFGVVDEALTLFGFGVDSFIELISGVGVAHMVWRIRRAPASDRSPFERTALRVTGFAFYALVAGLVASAALSIWTGRQPETTIWGVVISLTSILVMGALVRAKTAVGEALGSRPILADASCTRVCIYMSVILLISSGLYALFRLPYVDAFGTLGLAWFSFREGQECFEKARSNKLCGCDDACH